MNQITVVGKLAEHPESRYTKGGQLFRVVKILSDDENRSQRNSIYHKVVFWGRLAELAHDLQKGDTVCVMGRIEYRQWISKEGILITAPEIIAEKFKRLLSSDPPALETVTPPKTEMVSSETTQASVGDSNV